MDVPFTSKTTSLKSSKYLFVFPQHHNKTKEQIKFTFNVNPLLPNIHATRNFERVHYIKFIQHMNHSGISKIPFSNEIKYERKGNRSKCTVSSIGKYIYSGRWNFALIETNNTNE